MEGIKPLAVGTQSPDKQSQVSLPDILGLANGMALSASFSSILGNLLNQIPTPQTSEIENTKTASVQNATATESQPQNTQQSQQSVANNQQQVSVAPTSNTSNQNIQPAQNAQNQVSGQQVNQEPKAQDASQEVNNTNASINVQLPVSAQANNQLVQAPIENSAAALPQMINPQINTQMISTQMQIGKPLVILHNNLNLAGQNVQEPTGQSNATSDNVQMATNKNAPFSDDLMSKLNVSQVIVNSGVSANTHTADSGKLLDNLSTPNAISNSNFAQSTSSTNKADDASQPSVLNSQNPVDILTTANFASINYSMSDLSQGFKQTLAQTPANITNSASTNGVNDVNEVAAIGTSGGNVPQTSFEGVVSQSQVNMQERIDFIQNLVSAAKSAETNGQSRLKMVLNPPELGSVKVDLAVKDKVLSGSFKVENESAKELVLSHFGNLKSAVESHGIKVGDFNVNVQQGLEHQNSQSFESQNFNQAHHNSQVNGNYWQETKPVDEGSPRGAMPRASSGLQLIDVLA